MGGTGTHFSGDFLQVCSEHPAGFSQDLWSSPFRDCLVLGDTLRVLFRKSHTRVHHSLQGMDSGNLPSTSPFNEQLSRLMLILNEEYMVWYRFARDVGTDMDAI